MTQLTKQVVVESATDAVCASLVKLVVDIKAALATGKPLNETIQIGSALLTDLVPQIGNIPSLPADFSEDKIAAQKTIALALVDLEKALLS